MFPVRLAAQTRTREAEMEDTKGAGQGPSRRQVLSAAGLAAVAVPLAAGRQAPALVRRAAIAGARSCDEIDWIVVCMHQVSMSSAHFNGADLGIRESWLPLFDQYGVDLVVAGHEHYFERTFPVRGILPG